MLRLSKINQRKWFGCFLLLVLFFHAATLLIHLSDEAGDKSSTDKNTALKVRLLQNDQSRQIVQSEDTSNRRERPNAYLSDKTRSFERETRARRVDIFEEAAKGSASKTADGKKAHKKGMKDLKLSDLAAGAGEGDPLAEAAKEYTKAQKGVKSGNPASRGISSTNDHLEEVPLGDLTHLNTVEYKYYGFYHRIRQKLEQFWGRSIQEKAESLVKEGRSIASDEHITALTVVMDDQGRIIDIIVKGASGVREFDEAAVESFNEAGPFPNPPKDLIVNGRVTIEFGFVVQT